ncbi:MAG: hypothetical protein ACRENQ_08350 [Gemmatimonadaceae bacterium]
MKSSRGVLLFAALATAVAAGACSSAISDLLGVVEYNVFVTPGSPQPGPQGDTVYVTISNNGVNPAYLARCGDQPAVTIQVWQNNTWVQSGPILDCLAPSSPGPIEVDPGTPIVISNVYPDSGRYRVGVSVATQADLSDAAAAWTVGFDVP